MEKVYINKQECCGCSACASICPKGAIIMQEDEKGFKYPIIDGERCIDCGLCTDTCDFKVFKPTENKPDTYAIRHKDTDEVKTSRSGAFFMGLCKYVTDLNGAVFGCTLTDSLNVEHCLVDSYDKCRIFKGSKYVQSDIKNCFTECRQLLKNGKYVLFSGTGCQVHGLMSFLDKSKVSTEKLITVDLVCHGTPSPGVFKNYIAELENRYGEKITSVDFRDKEAYGWKEHIEKYVTETGRVYHSKNFTDIFYRHIIFRPSCYNCKYTTPNRKSDFTIADYWGIGKNVPRLDDNKGVSLVLVHTKKGKSLLEDIKQLFDIEQTNLATSMQPQLSKPIWKGYDCGAFWKKYKKNPTKAVRKYFFPSKMRRVYLKVEKFGKQTVKKMLKKIKK